MYKNKSILSWALYDWANSAFATVIIAGFFPVIFKSFWASNLSTVENTFFLGIGNAVASLIVMLVAPFLGAIGDKYNIRKKALLYLMCVGVISTICLSLIEQGDWVFALLLFVMATVGFMLANVFYDALLTSVSTSKNVDQVSGIGYGLGYLGGGIALAFCVYISQHPEILSVDKSIEAVLISFVFVGIWWFVFSLPLSLWTNEQPVSVIINTESIIKITIKSFKTVLSNPRIRMFLIAYWLYIDGVDTIIRMAVDYGMAIGFNTGELIQALLITQFVGFPAAILYGYIGARIGVKLALMIGIAVYALITYLGYNMQTIEDFYMLAVLIGLVQGGVQAMSRSFYTRMIPVGQSAEYFGIYNMLGKSAAVIGPLMMGSVVLLTGSHRFSILSILLLFILGGYFLSRVDEKMTTK